MRRKTLVAAGFVIATVLQGISYPAIALAADNTAADQPTSSLVGEQNSAAEDTDVQSETSDNDNTDWHCARSEQRRQQGERKPGGKRHTQG
ncbi:hypothetical protein [Bifidobacterium angulatum]|uniref:hypothetical protein n=1 Tax=Bifidobacterium angulatum TaxID=1683 RepID=UPI002E7620DD|nr:hypothetical protein [Bifidobacterium angulatum]MEE0332031.1 hypothetical protein [Bifidobacterium angulatum]